MYLSLTCSLAVVLFSFSLTERYEQKFPKFFPADYVKVLKKDFIKTVKSEKLIANVQTNFQTLFDKVKAIDGHYNADADYYYYVIFGKKNNLDKMEILKIEKADLDNETYTYIDFTNIDVENTTYCTSGPDSSPFSFVCTGPCEARSEVCLGAVCGVVVLGNCVQE